MEFKLWDLPPKTQVTVQTNNTTYKIETSDNPGNIWIQGGKYFPERTEVYFNGSSKDMSLKCGYLVTDMHMEVIGLQSNRVIVTSAVREITIDGQGISET